MAPGFSICGSCNNENQPSSAIYRSQNSSCSYYHTQPIRAPYEGVKRSWEEKGKDKCQKRFWYYAHEISVNVTYWLLENVILC